MAARNPQAVIDGVMELRTRFPDFDGPRIGDSSRLEASGTVVFDITHDGIRVNDAFHIRIVFPDDYPDSFPFVYETEGRVTPDFQHFMKAGNLCLGTPVEIKRRFSEHKSLLQFVADHVVPYLFSFAFKRDNGTAPIGERAHGPLGLVEYYKEHFDSDFVSSLKLLRCLADGAVPPEAKCVCGSGKPFRRCHLSSIRDLQCHYPPEHFEHELREITRSIQKADPTFSVNRFASKRMLRQAERKEKRKR